MTPSATTPQPWPEGRPPHMIGVQLLDPDHREHITTAIEQHLESCDDCKAWAEEHGRDDLNKWVWEGDSAST